MKAKITLFWMDLIRDRLKKYPFKNKDKQLVNDFLKPIVLYGGEAEKDLNTSIRKSILDVAVETELDRDEIEHFGKLLKDYEVEKNGKSKKRKICKKRKENKKGKKANK